MIPYRYSCIGVIWLILSVLSTLMTCICFYYPRWIAGELSYDNSPAYIGLFRRCGYAYFEDNGAMLVTNSCGRFATFGTIPHISWQITIIVIAVGCGVAVVISFIGILSVCINQALGRLSFKAMGVFQACAGLLIALGCLCFPIGWNNPDVQQICGQKSSVFNLGQCHLAWAYYLCITGSVLLIVASFLSCHSLVPKGPHYQKQHFPPPSQRATDPM